MMQSGRQTFAIDELADQITKAIVCPADIMNRRDSFVLKLCNYSRFSHVGFDVAFTADAFRMRHFNRDLTFQLVVESKVNSSETASSKYAFDSVPSQSSFRIQFSHGQSRR